MWIPKSICLPCCKVKQLLQILRSNIISSGRRNTNCWFVSVCAFLKYSWLLFFSLALSAIVVVTAELPVLFLIWALKPFHLWKDHLGKSSFPLLKQLVFSKGFLLAFIPELIWLELELVESFWHRFSWENADLSKTETICGNVPVSTKLVSGNFFFPPSPQLNFWYGRDRKRNHR